MPAQREQQRRIQSNTVTNVGGKEDPGISACMEAAAANPQTRPISPLTMILGRSSPGRTATWNSARTPAVLTGMARRMSASYGSDISSCRFSCPCCRRGAEMYRKGKAQLHPMDSSRQPDV